MSTCSISWTKPPCSGAGPAPLALLDQVLDIVDEPYRAVVGVFLGVMLLVTLRGS